MEQALRTVRNAALEQLSDKTKEVEIITVSAKAAGEEAATWAAKCAEQKLQYPSRTLCYSVCLALQLAAPQAVKMEKQANCDIRDREAKQMFRVQLMVDLPVNGQCLALAQGPLAASRATAAGGPRPPSAAPGSLGLLQVLLRPVHRCDSPVETRTRLARPGPGRPAQAGHTRRSSLAAV